MSSVLSNPTIYFKKIYIEDLCCSWISTKTRPKFCLWLQLRMGRIRNFIWIKYQIIYPHNFEYKSNMNIQWLQIRLEYWTVSRYLDAASSCDHGLKSMLELLASWPYMQLHWSFCLLSDLNMKTTSYSHQTYPHISYVHTLGYKIK